MSKGLTAELAEQLRSIGFTQYEARVYIALLRSHPLNGNEVSLVSGVPSSKCYETLRRLANKGAVGTYAGDDGTRYVALSPSGLIERYRTTINHTLDHLEDELGQLSAFEVEEHVLVIQGELSLASRVRDAIDSAQHDVYMSLWDDDVPAIRRALLGAQGRGVHMHVILYGDADLPVARLYRHSHIEIVRERIGGRMLVLVVDGVDVVIGRFADGGQLYGLSTKNQALALLAQEYLQHDIILECAKDRIDRKEWDAWWKNRPDLTEIILAREPSSGGELESALNKDADGRSDDAV